MCSAAVCYQPPSVHEASSLLSSLLTCRSAQPSQKALRVKPPKSTKLYSNPPHSQFNDDRILWTSLRSPQSVKIELFLWSILPNSVCHNIPHIIIGRFLTN